MTIAEHLYSKFTPYQLKTAILTLRTDFMFFYGYKVKDLYNPNRDSLIIKFNDDSVLNISRYSLY